MNTDFKTSDKDRGRATRMVMNLLDHWDLPNKEQLSLLGLSKENRAALSKYRDGHSIANDRDKLERLGLLLSIHKSLRLLFPNNRELVYGWIKQPNRAFHGASPVQVIDQYGMAGLYMVRAYLDRQRGQ